MLSSLCVDLRISEVVDAGQYIVSALLPLAVFTPEPFKGEDRAHCSVRRN